MNNSVLGKTMENVRKLDKRRSHLVAVINTTKRFAENLLAIKISKSKVKMNKPVYLGLQNLDSIKTAIYQYCHDLHKAKVLRKAKLCCTDTDKVAVCMNLKIFM